MNTQLNLEHALLYCIEVNLSARRVGLLDRILVLASPVNDINMFAWDLNRVLCFVESDIGIRMQLCRTCMGLQETTITFMLSKQFIRPCLAFLCREARVSAPPVSEHGAFVYYLNHVCGVSPPPAGPAPPPPSEPAVAEPIPMTPRVAESPAEKPGAGSSRIPPVSPVQQVQQQPPPVPRQHRDRPPPPPPLSLAEDSGTTVGSSSYFYFSPKDSDPLGFFTPIKVPPRNIPRKGYDCALPAIAQPYCNTDDWSWLPQSMHFEGPYQISSRVTITDTGTVVHEPNVLGNKAAGAGPLYGRQLPLPPRRSQGQRTTRRRTLEFQTAHTIAFDDPVPPQVPAKSTRKSPSYPSTAPPYPPSAPAAKRTAAQLDTCHEGDDDDDYIVVANMASVVGKKEKPCPLAPSSSSTDHPELDDEVVTTRSFEVSVALDVSHTTTYTQESPRPPPRDVPRVPPHLRKQARSVDEERRDSGSLASGARPPPVPPKVDKRGDDQAGLLDFEKQFVPSSPKPSKPVPKPRSKSRAAELELRTSVSVNILSEGSEY